MASRNSDKDFWLPVARSRTKHLPKWYRRMVGRMIRRDQFAIYEVSITKNGKCVVCGFHVLFPKEGS